MLQNNLCSDAFPEKTTVYFPFLRFRLLGVDKLFSYAINEWLNDIKTNQLQGILSGVAPIHTLVKLGEYGSILLLKYHSYVRNLAYVVTFIFCKHV